MLTSTFLLVLISISAVPVDLGRALDGGACLSLPPPAHTEIMEQRIAAKRGTMGITSKNIVATSHPLATQTGRAVLAKGGNAVDAFIAAVLTQDLVLPGVTSSAGIAAYLIYNPKTKKTLYVHAPYRTVRDPAGVWKAGAPVGQEVLLPGAPFALLEGQKQFGRMPIAKVLEPVIAIAKDGFTIDALYARSIKWRQRILESSKYGTATFFRKGIPLGLGDTLKMPIVARTLSRLATLGLDEVRKGQWANDFLREVNAHGGKASKADLAGLRAEVIEPLSSTYRGWTLMVSSGASFGGAKLLAQLKTLEHATLSPPGPLSASSASLELLARTHRAIEGEGWIYDQSLLRDPPRFTAKLEAEHNRLYLDVAGKKSAGAPVMDGGTHSSAVIVVDADGMVVVGTHTIETVNWGQGLFVGGFPLATAAATVMNSSTIPGDPISDPLSSVIAFRDGAPRAVLTTYGTGLSPADVQVLSNVIDFNLSAEDAVLAPRLGWFSFDITNFHIDRTSNLLDLRVPRSVICPLGALGTSLIQHEAPGYPAGVLDLGFPTLVTLSPPGSPRRLTGMTPEWVNGAAAGD